MANSVPFKLVSKQKLVVIPAGKDVLEIEHLHEGVLFKLFRGTERDVLTLGEKEAFHSTIAKRGAISKKRAMTPAELNYHKVFFNSHAFQRFSDLKAVHLGNYGKYLQNALKKVGR